MTDKQKEALASLVNGPAPLAIIHFGALRDKGYVEKAPDVAMQRGYTGASITVAGRAALQNA